MARITLNVKSVHQNQFTSLEESPIIKLELPTGEKMLADIQAIEKTKKEIVCEKYPGLIGKPITVTEAAKKYDVARTTIFEWVKNDYIKVLKPGYRIELDAADLAYCVDIYQQRKARGTYKGAPLLDENGLPYELKHPWLSEKRKNN